MHSVKLPNVKIRDITKFMNKKLLLKLKISLNNNHKFLLVSPNRLRKQETRKQEIS